MRVVDLWRFPVKSLQGESLNEVEVGPRGLVGDRSHALLDVEKGVVLTARRDPALLFGRGVLTADGAVVEVPGHGPSSDPPVLSAWVGKPVELVAPSAESATYEVALDDEHDTDVRQWQGPVGTYHDSTRTQISIVATGDLRNWDRRRFRANVIIDAETADVLLGHRVRIGSAEVEVVKQIDRCVMVTRPQPDGLDRDLSVLKTIRDERSMLLAVGSMVRTTGRVAVGDEVAIID